MDIRFGLGNRVSAHWDREILEQSGIDYIVCTLLFVPCFKNIKIQVTDTPPSGKVKINIKS